MRAEAILVSFLFLLQVSRLESGPPLERAEVKVSLAGGQLARALRALELDEEEARRRTIYFFDTRALELFRGGTVLRGRGKDGGEDDSTAKLRPMDPDRVDRRWFELDGFKCETDRAGDRSVESCSLTRAQRKGELGEAEAGRRPVRKLFSREQERFLETYASARVPWERLEVLGPVEARVWELRDARFQGKLVLEAWRLPGGPEFLELSTRSDPGEAEAVQARLIRWVQSRGLALDPAQEGKTRAVLEYLAGSRRDSRP